MAEILYVPDLGSSDPVDVIELLVAEGDTVTVDQTIAVVESAKASVDIPSTMNGVVSKCLIKVGSSVKTGDPLIEINSSENAHKSETKKEDIPEQKEITVSVEDKSSKKVSIDNKKFSKDNVSEENASVIKSSEEVSAKPVEEKTVQQNPIQEKNKIEEPSAEISSSKDIHAGPAVRRLARELGVDLSQVKSSGDKERILKEDVHSYIKTALTSKPKTPDVQVAVSKISTDFPVIDFSKWGKISEQPFTKIQILSARNLTRNWQHIPHVTQFDEVDITELESFRKIENPKLEKQGVKLTVLSFLLKAVSKVMAEFPKFNASLASDGQTLILKSYCHLGFAVETPNGLVVPVIRDVDQKTVVQIAVDLSVLSKKARDKALKPDEMQGGCFTISSLGGLGGTAFTPIINWPEVAILGVSKMLDKPIWIEEEWQRRSVLPLSLSYDHRVIDGADAARFTTRLCELLADLKRWVL
ncbi:MAG: 2-oxo acid dehydrogenase subunit E2 [Pseudomonadota bacterium]